MLFFTIKTLFKVMLISILGAAVGVGVFALIFLIIGKPVYILFKAYFPAFAMVLFILALIDLFPVLKTNWTVYKKGKKSE